MAAVSAAAVALGKILLDSGSNEQVMGAIFDFMIPTAPATTGLYIALENNVHQATSSANYEAWSKELLEWIRGPYPYAAITQECYRPAW